MKLHGSGFQKSSLLSQNLRKLAFEDKVALYAHLGTLVACFFPWASLNPLYGPAVFLNAFSGASWLIGSIVFCLSLFAVSIFVDELLEKKLLQFRLPRTTLLGAMSTQSLLLQLCAWSVLYSVGAGYAGVEFRFGLAACLLLQIVALVAAWLRERSSKKEVAKEFFQLPTHKKSGESSANPHQ